MRFRISVLISLIMLAYFAANMLVIGDAVGQGVDEYISNSKGELTYTNPAGFAATPKISRELQKDKTSMNWTMPNTLSGGGKSAKESRDQSVATEDAAQDTTAAAQDTTNAGLAAVQTELPAAPAASVTGSWSFQLNDNAQKDIILSLFQNGDALFGTGSMKEGNDTLQVAAAGSLEGDEMNLDITTLGSIGLYKLALSLSGDSASGDYSAFSASGDAWTGSANGFRY